MTVTAYSFIDPSGFRRVGATQSEKDTQKVLSQYPEIYDVTIETIQQEGFDAWRDAHDIQPTGPIIKPRISFGIPRARKRIIPTESYPAFPAKNQPMWKERGLIFVGDFLLSWEDYTVVGYHTEPLPSAE